ncbi:MAG TPA: hypothetical protein VMB48_14840 [Steroidobacteraceae bacterium]|nr:hypothetical protein [Steroidobacteraceae bacterium]
MSLFHAVPDAHLYPAEVRPVGASPNDVIQDFVIKQKIETHAGMVGGRVVQSLICGWDELNLNIRIIVIAVIRVRHFYIGYVTGSGNPVAVHKHGAPPANSSITGKLRNDGYGDAGSEATPSTV